MCRVWFRNDTRNVLISRLINVFLYIIFGAYISLCIPSGNHLSTANITFSLFTNKNFADDYTLVYYTQYVRLYYKYSYKTTTFYSDFWTRAIIQIHIFSINILCINDTIILSVSIVFLLICSYSFRL